MPSPATTKDRRDNYWRIVAEPLRRFVRENADRLSDLPTLIVPTVPKLYRGTCFTETIQRSPWGLCTITGEVKVEGRAPVSQQPMFVPVPESRLRMNWLHC